MASVRTKFSVGLFLIAGVLMLSFAIIWIGSQGYLKQGKDFVIYFDESVQGLEKDSQVKYRGVAVGRVEDIRVAPDGLLIQVKVQIDPTQVDLDLSRENVHRLVAQLKSVGITGIMFIELDRQTPKTAAPPMRLGFKAPRTVIASKPSDMRLFFAGAESLFRRIEKLEIEKVIAGVNRDLDHLDQAIVAADVKGISNRLTTSLDRANAMLAKENWSGIISSVQKAAADLELAMAEARKLAEETNKTVASATASVDKVGAILDENRPDVRAAITGVRHSVEKVQALLDENRKSLRSTMAEINRVVEEARKMAESGQQAIGDGSRLLVGADVRMAELTKHLLTTVQNLERATENLNRLLENTVEDPSALIFSRPVDEKPVAKEKQ
ncbi:MAG: MCE family protein [Deltaproteobacteria bacterium]|nr:MCE family protein [Deltaproteobacteria bacterium]